MLLLVLSEQRILGGISGAVCVQPEEAGAAVALGFAEVGHNTWRVEVVQINGGNLSWGKKLPSILQPSNEVSL